MTFDGLYGGNAHRMSLSNQRNQILSLPHMVHADFHSFILLSSCWIKITAVVLFLSSFIFQGLILKCQGYSPRIEALCQSLDGPLSALLQELASYVQESDIDRNEIQKHLQQCSSKHLEE